MGGWLRGKGGSRLEQEGGGKEGPSLLRREAGAAARLLEAAAGSRRSKQQQQRQQTCCLFISTATSRRQPGQLNQRSRGLSSQSPSEDTGQWWGGKPEWYFLLNFRRTWFDNLTSPHLPLYEQVIDTSWLGLKVNGSFWCELWRKKKNSTNALEYSEHSEFKL